MSQKNPLTDKDKNILRSLKGKRTLKARPSKWSDLPPVLGLNSPFLKVDGTDVQKAKVGETYSEVFEDSPTKVQGKKPFMTRQVIPIPYTGKTRIKRQLVGRDTDEPIIVSSGTKIWVVLSPHWTKADQRRIDRIHRKYAAKYINKKGTDFTKLYKPYPVTMFPRDRFPNGEYRTPRWVPKVWNTATKEWLEADDIDCQNWNSIPESEKRVDYLIGVIPDNLRQPTRKMSSNRPSKYLWHDEGFQWIQFEDEKEPRLLRVHRKGESVE